MSSFSKLQTLQIIAETRIVPVFYHPDAETACQVVQACYEGGVRAFEFTNRGDFALDVFREVVKYVRRECPGLAMGAGTILDAPTAALYLQYGADFIVAPYLNPEVARLCNRHLIPYTPGCATATEVGMAHELGCDLVKIFPAGNVGGPSFIKNLKAPLPRAMFMATGAVEPTAENLRAWLQAGVTCVGMGSKLFPKEVVAAKDWGKIREKVKACFEYIA